jgi:hypothetical protein
VIALNDSLPLLRRSETEDSPLRQDWLCYCLSRAAEKAGYNQWWLAEHVTSSVFCYLSTDFDRNTVTLKEVHEIVRSVLQAIGYAEVGLHFEALNLPFDLCLTDLAREAGPGYELAFFQLLRERVQPALAGNGSNVNIYGLQSCVRHLRSVKTWSRSCSLLRTEIVEFLRAQLERTAHKTDLLLTIR